MNTCIPNKLEDITIPNKDKLLSFYNNLLLSDNMNMLLIGNKETCKSLIIKLIIQKK